MTQLYIIGGTMKAELRKQAQALQPVLRIGKLGLTEGIMNEIILQLKKKNMIKIKLLKSTLDGKNRADIINEVVEKSNSKLVSKTGNVFTIAKC